MALNALHVELSFLIGAVRLVMFLTEDDPLPGARQAPNFFFALGWTSLGLDVFPLPGAV